MAARGPPAADSTRVSVSGVWTVEGESRFIWLLSRDGTWEEFEAANEAYYASPERD